MTSTGNHPTARPAAIVACLVFVLATAAHAGYREGMAAYEQGDYQLALQLWLPDAQRGDERAQAAVGLLYYDGLGVERDVAGGNLQFVEAAAEHVNAAVNAEGIPGLPIDFFLFQHREDVAPAARRTCCERLGQVVGSLVGGVI